MMKLKRTVRDIIFSQITLLILLFDTVGVSLTGCCTAAVLNSEFGAGKSYFGSPKYELSPDRDEITLTSSRITTRFGRQSRSTWKERIPLDPVPEGLMRCHLTVEQVPDAQKYWHDGDETMIPRDRFDIEVESLPLRAGETLHLRTRPEEQYALSQPFRVRLIPRNELEEVPPDTDGHAGTPATANPAGELRLMIPVSCSPDGRSYELLTVAPADPRPNPYREWYFEMERNYREEHKAREEKREIPSYFSVCRVILSKAGGSTLTQRHEMMYQAAKEWDQREELRYYYPFLEGQEEARMIEYERMMGKRFPSFEATLLKAFLLPPAVVVDVALLPITLPGSVVFYFGSMAFALGIQ